MSNLTEKTKLLLHVLNTIPNSQDIVDVKIEGRGQGILFSWSYINEGIGAARFQAENRSHYVEILQMVDDPRATEETPLPIVARKTALAFFVQQTINMQREPADQMAIPNLWPEDLINAAGLTRAMKTDIERRLLNRETVDMTVVLDRLITLFEQFEL